MFILINGSDDTGKTTQIRVFQVLQLWGSNEIEALDGASGGMNRSGRLWTQGLFRRVHLPAADRLFLWIFLPPGDEKPD